MLSNVAGCTEYDICKELHLVSMFQKDLLKLQKKDELFALSFKFICSLLNYDTLSVFTCEFDDSKNKYNLSLHTGHSEALKASKHIADALNKNQTNSYINIKTPGLIKVTEVRQIHIFPISYYNKVKAVITVSDNNITELSDKDKIILEVVCNHLAVIMCKVEEEENCTECKNLIAKLEEKVTNDELRSEFLVNLSHEFRTPLNIILTSIQLIISKPAEVSKYIYTMRQNVYRLMRMINNLIDITKIDAGYFKLNLVNCNIVNIIEDITFSVSSFMKENGIDLIFDTQVEELIISCDLDCLERIMLNLLSNALKFSKPGSCVKVNIYDKKSKVIITVTDTGKGIPKSKLSTIFERYSQVKNAEDRSSEGSGIGLSLVKSLVNMHGGNVTVTSKLGLGTRFRIELPVNKLTDAYVSEKLVNNIMRSKIESCKIEFSDIYNLNS